jgi:spore coat protein U-like protein
MNKLFRNIAAGALLAVGMPLAAWAQVNVNVQVQVVGTCSLSAPVNANFGSQGPTASMNLTATGSVTLTCNRGAAPVVAVNNGGHFSGTRRMADSGPTNYVGYAIKQPTISGTNYTVCPTFGGGSVFGAGGDALTATPAFSASGGQRTVNLCFETTIDQNTPVATYTDTVEVSVAF